MTYNTWPLMDGQLVPAGLFAMTPVALATCSRTSPPCSSTTVCWPMCWRLLAIWHAMAHARITRAPIRLLTAGYLALGVIAQAGLGIWTLLWVVPSGAGAGASGGRGGRVRAGAVAPAQRIRRPGNRGFTQGASARCSASRRPRRPCRGCRGGRPGQPGRARCRTRELQPVGVIESLGLERPARAGSLAGIILTQREPA